MLRITVISLVSILVVSEVAFAQQMEDVVHLKNGRIIRGVIIEQIPDESVKIQLQDGSVSVFVMGEIAKIEREAASRFQQFVFQQYVGRRIRVTQDNVQIVGTVTRFSPGGFSLASERGDMRSYNFNEGVRIEKSLGIKRSVRKGFRIGFAVGSAVGIIALAGVVDNVVMVPVMAGMATVMGTSLGAYGAAAGYFVKSEKWEDIQQFAGQRVRVTQDNVQIIGTVTRVFPGGFSLSSERGDMRSYNFNEGIRIKKSLGMKRNVEKGLLIGSAVGGVVASIIIENDENLNTESEDPLEEIAIGLVLATVTGLGGLTGAAVGYIMASEKWEDIPNPGNEGMTLSPVIDVRFDRGGDRRVVVGGRLRF